MQLEINHCKYCGEEIASHLFCCKSCWKDFESDEAYDSKEDEDEDEYGYDDDYIPRF